jgi:exopolysaccharide biosynthesis polyprenyl glycosylphosphotransferase
MKRKTDFYFILSLALVDGVMMLAAFAVAYQLRFQSGIFSYVQYHEPLVYAGVLVLQILLFPVIFVVQGLYRSKRSVSWVDEVYAVFSSVSVGSALVMALSAFIWRDTDLSRLLLALQWLLTIVLIVFGRLIHHMVQLTLRSHGVGEDRMLIVGTGDIGRLVLDRVRFFPGLGYRAVGFLSEGVEEDEIEQVPVLGHIADVGQAIVVHRIDEVIIALPNLSHRQLLDIIDRCRTARVNIRVFPDLFQIVASEVNIGDLNGLPLITVRDLALKGWNIVVKRAVDLVLSAIGLVLLSPLMLIVAVLIKITSPGGPVFYAQERVGLDGKPFHVIKFRSMRPDAERDTGPVWTHKGDPRTTRLGATLRRYSLDELPQLVNVLLGEMSLVGPRPERPHFVEQFREKIPRYFDRHQEKAGLTGWAQVNGLRGNTSIEERTAFDLWYVENWNIWLDLKILLRSLSVVIRDKNAY